MGSLLESLPRALAARAERSGYLTLAKACLVGAIVGRTVLQVPRALICAWGLVENAIFSAGVVTAITVAERLVSGVKWSVDKVSPERGQAHVALRLLLNQSVDLLRNPFFAIPVEELVVDDLGEGEDDAGPDMNQRVAQRTNAAMRRFATVDDTVDNGRLVREMADSIVDDLRRFCARAPDNTAFRGGVALLRDFVDLTFEEAHWVAPERL